MTLRDLAIRWYRKAFGAPAGTDIRDEGLDTVMDGNSAVAFCESAMEALVADVAEGPRGIVASATGLALAGRRATAFLSGPDLAAAQDLLLSAAGKHAPFVLHATARSGTAHGTATGSGHDTIHLCADSGCFMLFATSVQQAVDFTFIARRVAEETLVPGIVVIDDEQTATAPQDVRLPSPTQVELVIGGPTDRVDAPTAAQKMLFGDTRRRLPAWHNLDEPLLTGAVLDERSFALGAAARRPFFDSFVDDALAGAFEAYAGVTGRNHATVTKHNVDNAEVVLVVQGAAYETACVAADEAGKRRVGVLGINTLRPFPARAIADAVAGTKQVFVLERLDAPLAGEPPLTCALRASLYRVPDAPPCRSAVYGVGGLPLRVQDLIALCSGRTGDERQPLFLGVAFDDEAADQPKREVLLDTLRRAYPDIAALGIRASDDAAPRDDAVTIAMRGAGTSLVGTAAALLHKLEGGRIRSRLAAESAWLMRGDETLLDPGDGLVPDITLDAGSRTVTTHGDDLVFSIDVDEQHVGESLLGGLFAALHRAGFLAVKARRISSARADLLDEDDDARVAAFEAGLKGLAEIDAATVAGETHSDTVPLAVRELGRSDDHVASLPRFWDQTGVLYRDGEADRLTADPYLATGTMPPLSATFNSTAPAALPGFDSVKCTGCGLCWTRCPDSAIGVVAAGPAALIDAGISATGAEAVRQVASKLAARIISVNKKAEAPPATFGDMLGEAFAWLKEKAPLPEERKQAIEDGVERIMAASGALPVAVTKPFFVDAEARQKDSAELLSIAVNPDACKACGICVSACEPEALVFGEQSADNARQTWETWSATPDTAGTSIERAAESEDVGATAAMLLSRYCQFAMSGGDPAEPGSGEKLAVRLFLGATEYHSQPIVQRFAEDMTDADNEVRALIHTTLSGALPDADLDAIAKQLEDTSSPRVDLTTLARSVSGDDREHSIDTRYLRRLISLSDRLGTAKDRLISGSHGLGRARYGLAVAGGSTAEWAAHFPHNPFQVPTVVDMSGDAAQLAAGLVEGHLQETTELVRLLRLARLEVAKPDGLDWQREEVERLGWRDLDHDELQLCPPLVLIGSDEMLAGRGLSQLIWLLNSDLPVKVLLLSSLDLGLTDTSNNRAGVGMLALAQRKAFVAQSSIAHAEHFGDSVLQALRHDGPALVQVYAPSPSRDGFATDATVEQASRAVAARVLPLFCYDPAAEGVFGLRISLDGNPEEDELTVADWLGGQARFAPHLDTPASERVAADCAAAWQTLQELAGVVTPFTERLEEEIRAAVAAEHQAELDEQKRTAAAEIEAVRETTQAEIAGKLRSRLLELTRRHRK